jgi:aryl-alcohol dehydrogenase-like predicted oxidoreductase
MPGPVVDSAANNEVAMQVHTVKDVNLSAVGLGGFEFESDPGWSGAEAVVAAAVGAGINWVDTAEVYFEGMNERAITAALGRSGLDLMLSSKVAPAPTGSGLEPDQIRNACRSSLERLGADHLDLYFVHWPDESIPVERTWEAMRGLVDDGFVRLAGLSNFSRELIERCRMVGPVDIVQDGLCPIDHLENRALFAWCREQGIAVVTYEPLGNGMLAGAITAPSDFARVVADYAEWPFWKRLFSPGRFERSQAVTDGMRLVADRLGCTLAQLALAWNLHQPGVTATLAGSRNPVHVRQNAEAAEIRFTDAQLAELEALIPLGPLFA